MALYGRMYRYKRIVESLQLVLEDMDDDDGKARQWVVDALQLMQEKLDQASEEYLKARKEGRIDGGWGRFLQYHDPEDD